MISFPNAKINLGLHVIDKRSDGFHNIETCFYPISWNDALEVIPSKETVFTSSGIVKFQTMRAVEDFSDVDRMTRFGRFIRATSLDELPQLFQVLTGEMSLIGPRPLLITYDTHYSEEQRKRFEVKPGITGWAQVHGRNKISWENRFRYDNYYVKNVSFKLDMRILVGTIFQVLKFSEVNASDEETMKPFKK